MITAFHTNHKVVNKKYSDNKGEAWCEDKIKKVIVDSLLLNVTFLKSLKKVHQKQTIIDKRVQIKEVFFKA